MKKFLLEILVFLFFIPLCCACVARKSEDYFPLAIGNSWIYRTEIDNSGTSFRWKLKVTGKEKIDGQECAVVESYREGSSESILKEYYVKSNEGVIAIKRCYPDGEVNFNPPELYMKIPPQVGLQWEWRGKIMDRKAEYIFKIDRRDRVKVSSGEYDCLKISLEGKDDTGEELKSTRWFANGIGMVKEESSLVRGTREQKLKAFLESYEISGKSK